MTPELNFIECEYCGNPCKLDDKTPKAFQRCVCLKCGKTFYTKIPLVQPITECIITLRLSDFSIFEQIYWRIRGNDAFMRRYNTNNNV